MDTQIQTNKESRLCTVEPVNIEQRDGTTEMRIGGYAAMFEKEYDLGAFTEVIRSGAFNAADMADVVALFNHDGNYVLGRTTSGTLELAVDDVGLRYSVVLPESPQGMSVYESIRRGDITQSSWAFIVETQGWKPKGEEGRDINLREITGIKKVYDVSPVTYPANPDTTVAARSMPEQETENNILSFTYLDATLRLREIELLNK